MWGYGKDTVTVSIFEKASAEEAATALTASASSVNGAHALKADGVGDEAYLIAADATQHATQHPERGQAAGVMFRKGKCSSTSTSDRKAAAAASTSRNSSRSTSPNNSRPTKISDE
jgi:tetraacyldisaccharide-1-P 4'-kinase